MAKKKKKSSPLKTNVSAIIAENEIPKLRFHYLKSPQCRTIHMDGVHGGITPQGKIQMAMFSERFPIPRETVHSMQPNGTIKEITEDRVVRDGAIREIEINVIMDESGARALVNWLTKRLDSLKQVVGPEPKQGT